MLWVAGKNHILYRHRPANHTWLWVKNTWTYLELALLNGSLYLQLLVVKPPVLCALDKISYIFCTFTRREHHCIKITWYPFPAIANGFWIGTAYRGHTCWFVSPIMITCDKKNILNESISLLNPSWKRPSFYSIWFWVKEKIPIHLCKQIRHCPT